MNAKQIVYSGIIVVVWSEIVNTITAIFTMGYYTNPAYFSIWSKLMMSTSGPPSSSFYIISIAFSLITGLIFAGAYSLLRQAIPGKGLRKGLNYGMMLFLIAGVPFTLTTYLLLAVPSMLLVTWAVSSLIVYVLSGITFSKIIK